MAQKVSFASPDGFSAKHGALIERLYAEADCARWGLPFASFAEALRRSAEKRFRGAPASAGELGTYLNSLHMRDLALACACAEGLEAAWEFFVAHFRQDLRAAARAILSASGTGDIARAEELADSLYAELYGVSPTGAKRRNSLFEYFHGRSKLSTWLRALLAQRHVDLLRANWRTVPIDQDIDMPPRELAQPTGSPKHDPDRDRYLYRIDIALSGALSCLTPRERMILAGYYIDRLALAEIGRMLREHESTISRQLDRIRRGLRETVTESLRRGSGSEPALDEAQIELAFEYAVEDWPFDLSRALSKGDPATKSPET